MSLVVHLALVFHVFIAVAIMVVAVMVCGRHGTMYNDSCVVVHCKAIIQVY